MSRKETPDLMGELLTGKSKKAHERPTKDPRTNHKQPTEKPQRATLEKYHIRLAQADWKALQAHFRAKGIPVSAGIRMILKEYLQKRT